MYFDLQLWSLTRGLRGRIALGVLLGLLSLCVGIARFVFLGALLVRVLNGASLDEVLGPAAGVAASILLRGALEHQRTILAHRTAARVQADLRARLFDKVVSLGPAWFAGNRTGGVMLAIIDGVEQLQTFFGQYLPQLFISACAPFAIFAVIAWWDLPVACVMLAAAVFALILPGLAHRQNSAAAKARQRSFKEFGEEFLDAMQGLPTLKAFGQSRSYGRMLAAKARTLTANTMWVLGVSVMTRGITDLGIALGAAAALSLGAYRVTQGTMTLEALLIVLMAGTEIFRPLRDLRTVLHQGMVGQSAAGSVLDLLNAEATAPAGGSMDFNAGRQPSIAFEHVRFAYPGSRARTFDDLTFEIAAGERVGVVGPSGAGKSTLVRLLQRLYDPAGGIVRIGGRNLAAIAPEAVRGQIAVVAQDTYLFHGSVEDNLRLGHPHATEQEIEAVARAANAHDFITALPDGYRTLIGERGTRLSGGQRQRIAIARALLVDAPILILDEALSSVDAENEALIQEALDRLMQGRTTIILAHRLSSVIGADRILVMAGGQVVDSGSHDELIRREGPYRTLMAPQMRQEACAADALSDAEVTVDALDSLGEDVRSDQAARTLKVRDLDADAANVGWGVTFGTLMGFIRPWRRQLAATTTLGIARVVAFIAVGVLGALAIAEVKTGAFAQPLILALLVVAPLAGLLHWLESWLAHDMAYRLLAEMRIALYEKLEALAPAYLIERRSGDLVSLATQDVETVEYFFAHTVAPAIVAIVIPLSVLAWLVHASWGMAAALLPFLAYAGLAPVFHRRSVDETASRARAALGQLGAHVTETIQGLAELMAFRATGARRSSFLALVQRYQTTRLALLADLARQSERLEIATGLGGLSVALVGAQLVAQGHFAPTMLPLFILISVAAFLPVSEIAQVSRQLADTIASTRRLHVVHDEPQRIVDGRSTLPLKRGGIGIEFDHVRFTYQGREAPALAQVSFTAAPGTTVALVGRSGAGKTTIANLLLRFWDPDAGVVTLDGIDLRDLPLDELRRHIALVAQDTYLFNDTLEANVRLAKPDASAEEMHQAMKQAALADFVADLPDGLQTRVGERGVQLSGGQRQRIAIARAFLKDAPILVLDEATSHLDTISEAQVRNALTALMRDRTTLLIAHRLSTIRDAHQILVLSEGHVLERGTHDELLRRPGFYARLVDHQTHALKHEVAASA